MLKEGSRVLNNSGLLQFGALLPEIPFHPGWISQMPDAFE